MLLRAIYLLPVRLYQLTLSRVMPRICRFEPTCSRYFAEAVLKKGILRGTWMGLRRICRCHPLGGEGVDPVE